MSQGQRPEMKASPISDTATFTAEAIGRKRESWTNLWIVASGIIVIIVSAIVIITGLIALFQSPGFPFVRLIVGMLIVGGVLIPIGHRTYARVLIGSIEGEVYKATAKMGKDAEVTDIICDTRLIITGGIIQGQVWVKNFQNQQILSDFKEIQKRVETVLPSFMVDGKPNQTLGDIPKEKPAYWTDNVFKTDL